MDGDFVNEERLFAEALERSPGADREAFLAEACGDDVALRRRMEQLLGGHERASGLLGGAPNSTDPTLDLAGRRVVVTDREPIGSIIAGRFELLELIGEGGMGDVYVAEQLRPVRRKVALKLIKSGLDSRGVLARFEQERQALALMDHPNIAKVFDGGLTDSGRPFFVMEYIKGIPITEYCDHVKVPIRERLILLADACHAVQHAHQKGIIHRDLKPSNILVALYDGRPVIKVIDFGLAKLADRSLTDRVVHTAHRVVMGTPLYMSPEQATLNNLDIDTRSDVYALGVVLYELLTGSTPIDRDRFSQAAWDEALRLLREEDPPTPSARLSSSQSLPSLAAMRQQEPARLPRLVRGELDWIVMKALEKDRSRRYDTANNLALDIQRFLADEPVEAGPPSIRYRLRKLVSRHRSVVIGASAFAAMLMASVAVSTWMAVRAMHAERQATQAKDLAIADRDEKERARKEAVASEERARKAEQAEREAREAESEARQSAEYSDRSARAELAKFELINQFLTQDILGQAEPENNAAEDHVTLLEVLDRAAAKVGNRYDASPNLEVELRRVIARAYHSRGAYLKSQQQWQAIEARARALLGEADPMVWLAIAEQGHMLHHVGKFDQGIVMEENGLEGLRQTVGPEHADTHLVMNNLALAYLATGQTKKALFLLEPLFEAAKIVDGAIDKETTSHMLNLTSAYLQDNQLDKALPLAEKVLELSRTSFGLEHPSTILSLMNLATAKRKLGRVREALPLSKQAYKLAREVFGPAHPTSIRSLTYLASDYQRSGRIDDAITLAEEAVSLAETNNGGESPYAELSLKTLARIYWETERFDRCAAVSERLVEWLRKTRGPDNEGALTTLSNAAAAYDLAGRPEMAERLSREALESTQRVKGAEHPLTLQSMGAVADIAFRNGKVDGAILLGEELLRVSQRVLGDGHQVTIEAAYALAHYYCDAGRLTEANALVDEWLVKGLAAFGSQSRTSEDAHRTAASVLEWSGSPERAEAHRRALVQFWKEAPGDNAVKYGAALAALGGNLLSQRRPADAQPILESALEILDKRAPDRWSSHNARSRLGEALFSQQRYDEAESLLVRSYENLKTRDPKIAIGLHDNSVTQALQRLVQYYEATGKHETAANWRKELDAHRSATAKAVAP